MEPIRSTAGHTTPLSATVNANTPLISAAIHETSSSQAMGAGGEALPAAGSRSRLSAPDARSGGSAGTRGERRGRAVGGSGEVGRDGTITVLMRSPNGEDPPAEWPTKPGLTDSGATLECHRLRMPQRPREMVRRSRVSLRDLLRIEP